jgi:hypothetical protein
MFIIISKIFGKNLSKEAFPKSLPQRKKNFCGKSGSYF